MWCPTGCFKGFISIQPFTLPFGLVEKLLLLILWALVMVGIIVDKSAGGFYELFPLGKLSNEVGVSWIVLVFLVAIFLRFKFLSG